MNDLLIKLEGYELEYNCLYFFRDQAKDIKKPSYKKLILKKSTIQRGFNNHVSIYVPFKAYLFNSEYKGITYIRITNCLR